MCFPSGARVGSKRLGWVSRTKGRSVVAAVEGGGFRARDFVERAAEVDGGCAAGKRGCPGDGLGECPVDFEDAGAVVEVAHAGAEAGREGGAGDAVDGLRAGVEEGDVGSVEVASRSSMSALVDTMRPPRERGSRRVRWRGPARRLRRWASRWCARRRRGRGRRRSFRHA